MIIAFAGLCKKSEVKKQFWIFILTFYKFGLHI